MSKSTKCQWSSSCWKVKEGTSDYCSQHRCIVILCKEKQDTGVWYCKEHYKKCKPIGPPDYKTRSISF